MGVPTTLPAGVKPGMPFTDGAATIVLTQLRDRAGELQGVIRLGVESSSVAVTSATLRATGALAMVTALIVAIAVGALVTTMIGRPLRRLAQAAAAIAGGETHQHIEVKTNDEIGEVAEAFNTMSERVTHELEAMADKIRVMSVEIASLNTFGETLAQMPDARAELRRLTETVAGVFSADFATLYLEEEPFGLVAAADVRQRRRRRGCRRSPGGRCERHEEAGPRRKARRGATRGRAHCSPSRSPSTGKSRGR